MRVEKQALGKGLGALLGPGGTGPDAAYEVDHLPAAVITPNPYQPRQSFDDEGLQELASSIREHGVLQPIVVRRGGAANALRLPHLDPEVRARLESGQISEGHARTLVVLESPARQRELCEQLVQRGASVREAERLVREATRPEASRPAPKPRRPADPNLAEVEASLRARLGTRVAISRGQAHGTITIEF